MLSYRYYSENAIKSELKTRKAIFKRVKLIKLNNNKNALIKQARINNIIKKFLITGKINKLN